MPLEHGTVTGTFFTFPQKLPEDLIARFAAHHAPAIEGATEEAQTGWVAGDCLLNTNITEENTVMGSFVKLGLRSACRKIPGSYFKALCQQEESVYRKANNLEFVGSKIKREIKDSLKERLLMQMPPTLSGIDVVIAPQEKRIFISGTSEAQIDLFAEWFLKATDVKPYALTGGLLLEQLFETTESAFPQLAFAKDKFDEPTLGRDFLTWLWYFGETEGNPTTEEGDCDVIIEGPLTFARAAESAGAADTVIKNGDSPSRAAEAKAALAVGKKLKKAKFQITCNSDVWSGTFDADKFAVSGLKLPEVEALDDASTFEDRMQSLFHFERILRAYFRCFGQELLNPHFTEYQSKLQQWAQERESL